MEPFLTLKDHVYNYIAEQITTGNLQPNEKINENIISEKLNISRTPVREALIQLSAEGLLENIPRKGFIIKEMAVKEACDIYFIIGLLDGAAAELSCNNITEKQIKDMEFYIESMNLAIEKENYAMYYKCQEDFHNTYLDSCSNNSLVSMQRQLKKKFLHRSYVNDEKESIQKVLYSTNEEHKKILELFKSKDSKSLNSYIQQIHWDPEKAKLENL